MDRRTIMETGKSVNMQCRKCACLRMTVDATCFAIREAATYLDMGACDSTTDESSIDRSDLLSRAFSNIAFGSMGASSSAPSLTVM